MDDWENFNETTLHEKEEFYRNINMEDITDAGFMNARRVCKEFEIKNVGEHQFKSDRLILVDVFKNFRKSV